MSIAELIERKVQDSFAVHHFELANESHMHNVPANSETHFRLVLVTDQFQGMSRVRRHQAVYQLLGEEMKQGVHALALHTFTPSEWAERGENSNASPACRGGNGK